MELVDFPLILTHLDIWLAFLCFFFIKWYLSLKYINKGASINPIVGVPFSSLLRNVHRVLEWSTDVYTTLGVSTLMVKGPCFTRIELVFTCDPRNVEYILKPNFANFPKGQGFTESFDILGTGIFNADYDSWRVQMKMVQTRLKSMEFRSFAANASREVVEVGIVPLLEHVDKQGSIIDLQDVFMRFAYDTSCITIFGKNPRYLSIGLPTNQHAKASDDASEAIYYRHLLPSVYWKLLGWERAEIGRGMEIRRHLLGKITFA